MNRRNLLNAIILSGLIGLGSAAPAFADALADIKARGALRAAIDLGSPPFGMHDAAMQPIGSEVESAQLLADFLGVKLEIVEVTSPNRIPFLQSGQADVVIASLSITDERKQVIDFGDPHGVIQIVAAAPATTEIKAVEDLAGKDVAVTRGTTNDKLATTVAVGANIVRYDDDATLVTALVSGQNTVTVTAPQIVNAVNAKRTADPLEIKIVLKVNPYAVGIRKGEAALLAAVNDWVHTDLKNGKLGAIYKKYNNVDLPADMTK